MKSDTIDIIVYLIDGCNYNCGYCYNKLPRTNEILDRNVLVDFIRDVRAQETKKIVISFVGGEPSLYPGLGELCQQLKEINDISLFMVTNCSLRVDFYETLMMNGVNLILSWHGVPEDRFNKSFVEKAIYLHGVGGDQKVWVNSMLEHDNAEASKWAYETLKQVYDDDIEMTMVYYQDHESAYKCGKIDTLKLRMTSYEQYKFWKCNAGQDCFYIHVDGSVYNCQTYYEKNMTPLYNINQNNGKYMKEKHRPCICRLRECSCEYDVHRERIDVAK